MTDDVDRVPIGVFAVAARVTVKALRHYQRERLLQPRFIDPASGYRYYSWDQLECAVRIATLRSLDVPIDAIRALLDGDVSITELAAAERARRVAEIDTASAVIAALDEIERVAAPRPHQVDAVTHEQMATVSLVRSLAADHLDVGTVELIDELLETASHVGIDTAPPVWGEFPVELVGVVPVAVHLPIGSDTYSRQLGGAVGPGSIPSGTYARVVHRGGAATVPFAYRTLFADLVRNGHRPTGSVFERYLTDPSGSVSDLAAVEVLYRTA